MARPMTRLFLLLVLTPQLPLGERIHLHGLMEAGDEVRAKEDANASSLVKWNLFGKNGPKLTDVSQGQLGDCYYLAGLAAIAREHPEVIEEVFVDKGTKSEWSDMKVYLLKFLVDGVETMVALDEQVPMKRAKKWCGRGINGKFHFACTNDGHDVWPILMEKGFAKLFGSYLAIRSGWGFETFKAITQAPVDIHGADWPGGGDQHEWEDPEALWSALRVAIRQKFPMTGGTSENSFGTVSGHAFAVIGAKVDATYGRTVEVYNPWASNRYNGQLKDRNDQFGGSYSMTFGEFLEAFDSVEVARVRKGYNIHYRRVPVGKPVALRFSVSGYDPFSVQMEWPSRRFFNVYGCPLRHDKLKLMVSRKGEPGSLKHADKTWARDTSGLRVDMQGPGEYLVYAFSSFDGAPWAEEMAINTYSNEDISFEELQDPLAVGREMLGFPCQDLKVPGIVSGVLTFGLITWFEDDYRALPHAVGGSPAWQLESVFGSTKVIWMDDSGHLTLAPSAERLDSYYPGFDASKLECMADLPKKKKQEEEREEPLAVKRVETSCDYVIGERVWYNTSRGDWTCSEVETVYSKSLKVRYLRTGKETLGCHSARLEKVTQCEYHEEDHVEYFVGVDRGWVKEQIAEVNCGTVTLRGGDVVNCDTRHLRYPSGCPFHKDEKVLIWSRTLERWTFAAVKSFVDDKVKVVYKGVTTGEWISKDIRCDDQKNLKKLSRCDKLSHEQLARFRELDNYDDLLDGRQDALFRPNIISIGPAGADCGDSASGGAPEPCDMFNTWGMISEVLH